jgi:arginyl-tRNA synthetase
VSLLAELSELMGAAFAGLGLDPRQGTVVVSQRPELADFQCNGALAVAKTAGRSARELAEELARAVSGDPRIAAATVAGPGFVNLTVADDHLAAECAGIAADARLGVPVAPHPLHVLVDYAGPNVAKAMHVGHLRATIIGDSLQRLFRFAGHRVTRDPHFGDWGLQMGLVIAEIERLQPDLPYFDNDLGGPYPETSPVTLDDLQELYPVAAARAHEDPGFAERARLVTVDLQQGRAGYRALWRHMKRVSEESQRHDFADLGVEFDLWYGESDVADLLGPLVADLRARGLAVDSRGATVIPVTEEGETRELPPLILETSVGGYLYATTDLATIRHRADVLQVDLALYVVDARQADHFEVLFRAARKTGIAPPAMALEHIAFGTMNGKDGKPFKTRAGGVVRLRDLIDMVRDAAAVRLAEAEIAQDYPPEERESIARRVGLAALKFADLVNHRTSNYVFDLERFASFEGKTGPYLQYGAVRIKSILRNAAERGYAPGPALPPSGEAERNLVLELTRLPEVIERAIDLRAPNHVAEYAFVLAGRFNRFYDACHILSEPDPARRDSWLLLVDTTLRTLTLLLDLLGIEVPERM